MAEPKTPEATPVKRWQVIAAFAAVYTIWGSTYLAIRFAIDSIPPLFVAGLRALVAGGALFTFLRIRGAPRLTAKEWIGGGIVGTLLLFGGNGGVSYAELALPTGLTAVIVATVPLWIVILGWAFFGAGRPRATQIAGLLVGLLGILVLAAPGLASAGGATVPLAMVALLLAATASWGLGSVLSRRVALPESTLYATSIEMLVGGVIIVIGAFALGEGSHFSPAAVTTRSWIAMAYLVVFGSLIAFVAYGWLLKHVAHAKVATYAYVNPIVALALGIVFNREALTPSLLLASALILAAVVLLTLSPRPRMTASPTKDGTPPSPSGGPATGPILPQVGDAPAAPAPSPPRGGSSQE
ncbi:MAG: EamA family transporter [Thermoplasmatota archaeon]